MSEQTLNIIFFLGVAILIVAIVLLRSSQRKKFDNTPQIIQIWGLKLEVSILTLLFLISVGLIATNLWFQLQRINDQLKQINSEKATIQKERDEWKSKYEQATTKETEAYISLEGVTDVRGMELKNLNCKYTTKSGVNGEASLDFGPSNEKLAVVFRNLNRDVIITSLELTDQQGQGTIWKTNEEFQIFNPHTFRLTK